MEYLLTTMLILTITQWSIMLIIVGLDGTIVRTKKQANLCIILIYGPIVIVMKHCINWYKNLE